MKKPADCANMTDVRAEIDRVDLALVDLLAERWSYVDRGHAPGNGGSPVAADHRLGDPV